MVDNIKEVLKENERLREELKKVKKSEQKFRTIFVKSPVGIVTFDRDGMVTAINPYQLEQIDGGKPEDYVGKFNTLEFARKNNPELYRKLKDVLAGKKIEMLDQSTISVSGKQLFSHFNGNPLFDEKGECIGGISIVKDVTARVKAEIALRESEEIYRSIFDNAPIGIFAIDKDGYITSMNQFHQDMMWDGDFSDLIGKYNVLTHLHEDEQEMTDKYRKMLEEGVSWSFDKKQIKSSFERFKRTGFYFSGKGVPLLDEEGNVTGGIVLIDDVTEQVNAEKELRASEEKYRNFVENSLDGIVRSTFEDGRLLSFNNAFCKIMDYEPDELLNISAKGIKQWVDPNRRDEMLKLLEKDGKVSDFEYEIMAKGGEIKTVSGTARAIYDTDGTITEMEGILRDITERKKMELEHKEYSEKLEVMVEERTNELTDKLKTIEKQHRAIQELSTPIIQVWKGVLVVPLIGIMDSKRARNVMETLLEEVVRSAARIVLIDITGISMIATQTGDYLLKTVQALKLIGVDSVITGIRPEVAQILVELGIELDVRTESSLEAGLKFSLKQIGVEDWSRS